MMNGNFSGSWTHSFMPQQSNVVYSMHPLSGYISQNHNYIDPISRPTGFSTKPQQQNYHTTMYCGNGYQNPRNMQQNRYSNGRIPPPTHKPSPNTDGFINGIKSFVNGIINPKLKCDFYADHNRHYNPKYRNNFMRWKQGENDNVSTQKQCQQPQRSGHQPPEQRSLQTLIFNISMQPQILCNAQFSRKLSDIQSTQNTAPADNDKSVPNTAEVVAIFSSEDFPELPTPRQRSCVWDQKPKATTCSIFNLSNSSNSSSSKRNHKKFDNNNGINANNKNNTLPINIKMEGRIDDRNFSDIMENNRKVSECDSEDSFVIFTNQTPPNYININCRQNGNLKSSKSTAGATPFRPPKIKERQISECSDDSFVICFTNDAAEGLIEFSDNTSVSSDDDSDDSAANSDDDTDSFIGEMPKKTDIKNRDYNNFCSDNPPSEFDSGFDETKDKKKVRFNLKPEVHVMHTWDYAYRIARKGQWEDYARDRTRFNDRVKRLSTIISPILDGNHRGSIYKLRFCDKNTNHK